MLQRTLDAAAWIVALLLLMQATTYALPDQARSLTPAVCKSPSVGSSLDRPGTKSEDQDTTTSLSNEKVSMIYYPNWAIYERKFPPEAISNPKRFTHILYAFANVSPDGTVYLSDLEADLGHDGSAGCIERLQHLKTIDPELKVILSIGGWTYRQNFATAASTPDGRKNFATSAIALAERYGFDGLDLDWEYPKDATEGCNFLSILKNIRKINKSLTLMAAVSSDPEKYQHLPIGEMAATLDYWLLMAYDYAGSFSKATAHTSNLFPGSSYDITPFSTNKALGDYKRHGVDAHRVVLGMPLYGRDFVETDGLGSMFVPSVRGSWEPGAWDYKAIHTQEGYDVHEDIDVVAAWGYSSSSRTLISYDTPTIAKLKAKYIMTEGLAGAMWWEISGDIEGDASLIDSVLEVLRPLRP